MLSVSNLSLIFGSRILFENIGFQLYEQEKIGLIGKNGVGKTSLFKILTEELNATTGDISKSNSYRIGMLAQFFTGDESLTVKEETKTVFKDHYNKVERLKELERLLETDSSEDLLNEMADLHNYFSLAISNPEKDIEVTLKGLGFKDEDFDKAVSTFSGGWKMRIELAKLILANYDLILLDEPTNHLDIEAILWFEKFLQKYHGSFILISHDISFLNNTIKKVFDISNQKLNIYAGNYSKFIAEKAERRAILEETRKNQLKKLETTQKLVDRFRAKASKAKMAKSLEKQIARTEIIEVESEDIKAFNLVFPEVKRSGREVVRTENLSKSYGENNVLQNTNIVIERGDKVAFIGQNGTGKSTLLKILVDEVSASSGNVKIGAEVNMNYFAQDQADQLDNSKTPLEIIGDYAEPRFSTQLRSVLGAFLFSGEDVDKKISVLSGGEKTRLAIACMMVKDANVIVLDEPTNHLDIYSKDVLKQAIQSYQGTVIVVSHDRDFLSGLSNKSFEFRSGNIIEHLGDIDYVLEKREKDFRTFQQKESHSSTKSESNSQQDSKLSYEERKKIQRAINRIEKRINTVEERIKEINEQLFDPNIFKSEEGSRLTKESADLNKELEELMEQWETESEKIL